jgi:hypothetical protein
MGSKLRPGNDKYSSGGSESPYDVSRHLVIPVTHNIPPGTPTPLYPDVDRASLTLARRYSIPLWLLVGDVSIVRLRPQIRGLVNLTFPMLPTRGKYLS